MREGWSRGKKERKEEGEKRNMKTRNHGEEGGGERDEKRRWRKKTRKARGGEEKRSKKRYRTTSSLGLPGTFKVFGLTMKAVTVTKLLSAVCSVMFCGNWQHC